jgi:hypothetical protein
MITYDLLVYLALVPLVAAIILGGIVIWVTPATVELETRKSDWRARF